MSLSLFIDIIQFYSVSFEIVTKKQHAAASSSCRSSQEVADRADVSGVHGDVSAIDGQNAENAVPDMFWKKM